MIDALLKELTSALLEADVNVKLVASLRNRVKTKVRTPTDSTNLWGHTDRGVGEEELGGG